MEIDWARTLAVGVITGGGAVAIYMADAYEGIRSGEGTAGCAPLVGIAAGVVVGLLLANLLLA